MSTWIIDTSLGGTARIKVEADTEEQAVLLAQDYTIEDWENAGHLEYSDIHVDGIHELEAGVEAKLIDASIVASANNPENRDWEYAKDDPYGRDDDPSQEGV